LKSLEEFPIKLDHLFPQDADATFIAGEVSGFRLSPEDPGDV
jgi:hypothetical protein